jgi:hypothetical protein
MLRQLTLIALMMTAAGAAVAAPVSECQNTKYSAVMPALKDFKFGSTMEEARAALKKAFPDHGLITVDNNMAVLNFRFDRQDLFDQVGIGFTGSVASFIVFSYSDRFQEKSGGGPTASVAILEALRKRVGGHSDREVSHDASMVRLMWSADKGLSFSFRAKNPNVLILRFDCEPAALKGRAALDGSLGF